MMVGSAAAADPSSAPAIPPGGLAGYLPRNAIPDNLALLPPPAPQDSTANERAGQGKPPLQGAARWKLAAMDNDLSFPAAAGDFACALNAPVTPEDTPRLYQLLRKVVTDAASATRAAEDSHEPRQFLESKAPTCAPGENRLEQDDSASSTHTAIGWTWALILSEISPDQSHAILTRGRAFAQSGLVCDMHWESDTAAGLMVAAGIVMRLRDEPAFLADLAAAKTEIAIAHANHLAPQRDCKTEADALAQ
jgi:acid phosphatase (class A)